VQLFSSYLRTRKTPRPERRGNRFHCNASGMITYAVVGRNVACTLEIALCQALAAAEAGDSVVFVDSASVDTSATIARRLGVQVLRAPAGKGRAVAALLDRHDGGPLCLLDADVERSGCNIAMALRNASNASDADMVIARYDWPARDELSVTHSVHARLVGALFPEHAAQLSPKPLSGFRLLNTQLPLGRLPSGYGLEAHLNVQISALGGEIAWVDIGVYEGPVVRRGAEFAHEIGAAILDVAELHGRLAPEIRPAWEEWIATVADVFGSVPRGEPDLSPYRERLRAVAARALPRAQAGP
jgi:glucosyl-3-phosphoglycerate synthase